MSINEKTCLSRMLHEEKGVKVERHTASEECGNGTSKRTRYCSYYGTRLCQPLGPKETHKILQKEFFSKEGMKLPPKGVVTQGGKAPLKELTLSDREESMVVVKRVKLGRGCDPKGCQYIAVEEGGRSRTVPREVEETQGKPVGTTWFASGRSARGPQYSSSTAPADCLFAHRLPKCRKVHSPRSNLQAPSAYSPHRHTVEKQFVSRHGQVVGTATREED